MAKQAKKVETPAKKKVVKASGVKIRTKEEAKGFYSKKGTTPINPVWDSEKEVFVGGLTEHEKVAEGLIARRQRRYSFKKTEQEREEWRLVHTNTPGPRGGTGTPKNERKYTLIVHFINTEKQSNFISTRSFKEVTKSDIITALRSAVKVSHDTNPLTLVSKYYFAGKRYLIKDGKAVEA